MAEPWMGIPSPDGSSSGTELEPTLNADSIKTYSYRANNNINNTL